MSRRFLSRHLLLRCQVSPTACLQQASAARATLLFCWAPAMLLRPAWCSVPSLQWQFQSQQQNLPLQSQLLKVPQMMASVQTAARQLAS